MAVDARPSPLDASRSIVWRVDTRTLELRFISQDAAELLGFPAERWYAPGFWPTVLHPEDADRTLDCMRRAAAGEHVPDFSYRVQAADGRTVWLRTVARLTEAPHELLGVTFDETAKRRLDALLDGDLRIFRQIAAGDPLPRILRDLVRVIEEQADGMIGSILLLDAERRIRHAMGDRLPSAYLQAIEGQPIGPDQGSCGTAAYRREAVIVEDVAVDPLWIRYRASALEAGLRACWSMPIFASDRSVLGTFALYYGRPRRPSPELIELARHASNMAAVAIERDRRGEALRVSEERLALAYRHVDDVLFHLQVEPGPDYRFVSVNPAFCRSTGLEMDRIVGRSVRDVIPEPSLSLVLEKYDEAVRTHRTVHWEELTSYPSGARVGDVAVTPILDAAGRPQYLVGSVRDFTERRRMEEELRQLQKLEALGRLTGGVAHDFNNLLTVVLGYGEILRGKLAENDPGQADLRRIVQAGERAAALTQQLLAFARKQALQLRPVSLNDVLDGLRDLLRRMIRENIELRFELSPDLPAVMADSTQIEQVILNLALNAKDAIPENGLIVFETAAVELDAEAARSRPDLAPGTHVRLSIWDTGVGMDAGTRSRLFEPFFTTKPAGRGTGLGLATVYGIVKQTGGHVAVDSGPGRGTAFRIHFPRADAGVAPGRLREDAAPSTAAAGERVLVVEDEDAVRDLCGRLLRDLNYRVTEVADGEAAVAAVERDGLRPDILLTDTVMPGLGGRALVDRLRRLHPRLRVVFMSGYTDPDSGAAPPMGPGMAYLPKPFGAAALARTLRKVLEDA